MTHRPPLCAHLTHAHHARAHGGRALLAWSLWAACVGLSGAAWAQASPQSDPREALAERIVQLWHPEDVVVVMVQRPAVDALQQARIALQGRVTAERRDAALKDMASDVQQYIDQATPLARDSARQQLQHTVLPMLVQSFSAEELQQVVALLESPVKKKFEQFLPRMERALGEQVAAQCKAQIDPLLKQMTAAVGTKLRAATVGQ